MSPGGRSTVAVALSGGVDSSTAAALLVQQGFRVLGVTMSLFADTDEVGDVRLDASTAAIDAAREVCLTLGIPCHVVDLSRQFRQTVVDYLFASYLQGLTPNPCVVCNRQIKFGALMRVAADLGADYLATGHYAQVRQSAGKYHLLRGVDRAKDQSYMLYRLGQPELSTTRFPVGGYAKTEVRALAQQWGLPTARRAESQDLCFLQGADYRDLLRRRRPDALAPGPIRDSEGNVLGEHRGIAFYTVGQRQGIGLAAGEPLHVLKIDARSNVLVVGPRSAGDRSALFAEEVHYVTGEALSEPVRITAKVRYRAGEAGALLVPLPGDTARVVFDEPQFAPSPGQSVVFYCGDLVLGGGVIAKTVPGED